MRKLFLVLIVLISSFVLMACEKTPTINLPSEKEDPVVIRRLDTPEALVGFLLDLFIQGNDAYILDKNIDITVNHWINNQLLEVHDELVNIEFSPNKEQFITYDGSYKHVFKSELFGYVNIPIEYYFIEQQDSETYAIKSDLKKYYSLTIDQNRFNTYYDIEGAARTHEVNQYYDYPSLNEYSHLIQTKIGSIIQGFFINLFSSAFIGEFDAMNNGNYNYNLLKDFQISQTDAAVEISFEAVDLEGLSYGTNSGISVNTTVFGYVDVVNLEMNFSVHWKAYKDDQLWNESKYDFSLKQNTHPISFTSDKTYTYSIDVR